MATIPHPSGIELAVPANRLNTDINQIERMETDLVTKVGEAFATYGLERNIHGVFSLDDLEDKIADDLCNHIGVGVGYHKIEPSEISTDPKAPLNVDRGTAVKMLDYYFLVILAVPTNPLCNERHQATRVLTALRFAIMGSSVAGDITSRTWAFVKELPVVEQSSDTILYYSQVWRVAMPNVGNR